MTPPLGKEIVSDFSRVVNGSAVVLKKLSRRFFLVAPTTTKQKEGSWYIPIRQHGVDMFVCLHQIRTIDYRRLSSKMGSIDDADVSRIKSGFWKLYR